ncbi:hypothetical protein BGZ99_005934 [Dissophora globulifera]|uniref:Uncharacterized protein n=1 Tax=Dissophora globulifera TaxID=979702 RepID=A0A9P6REQ7_9FUNG|nr:hypothetical protein BGZ99_005934 [Dissophora globulifera]
MKSAIIFAIVAISAIAAQSGGSKSDDGRLFYSEPIRATIWEAGKTQTVSWTNVCKPENKGDLDIVLYLGSGNLNGTEQIRVPNLSPIGILNCLKSKSATVTLPANLTTSDMYAIHVDTEPLQSYSSPFTIKGISPPVTSAVPTSSATVPVASPSAPAPGTSSATGSKPSPESKTNDVAGSLKTLGATGAVLAAAIGSLLL